MGTGVIAANRLSKGYSSANFPRVTKDMLKLFRDSEPHVLFSGGKDSLVAMHIARKITRSIRKKVRAIHVDTTVSTPGNKEYVKRTCDEMGVELIMLKPKVDYFTLVERWGFPVMTRRWCKKYLKVFPVRDYLRNKDPDSVILVDGVRAQESWIKRSIRRQIVEKPWRTFHEVMKCQVVHPVYDWSFDSINKYIESNKLVENPLYEKYGRAFDCWCTVFKSPADMATLAIKSPRFYHKLVQLEGTQRNGGSALFDRQHSRRVYLRDIEAQPELYLAEPCTKSCACMTT